MLQLAVGPRDRAPKSTKTASKNHEKNDTEKVTQNDGHRVVKGRRWSQNVSPNHAKIDINFDPEKGSNMGRKNMKK